ncbi:MAG: hypothetical protein DLM57_14610 [Pseudonocardiales bacterium]|nr:MAG: hypothetical protein DLM57_14610 [Pseudonocardiales bacterium]
MGEHRVSMLGAPLRRYEDPARSADPRIRTLITHLAALDPAPGPRAHFRAELRAQLVAVAPRLIAEGTAIETPRARTAPAAPQHAVAKPSEAKVRAATGWTTRITVMRPLAAITAVIATFALLLGGAVLISKKALPGDALYGLKRANENVALSLAGSDADKGRKYLSFAQTRADEVSALLSRSSAMADGSGSSAAAGVNSHTAQLINRTLDSADSDVRNGAQLLNADAVSTGSADSLSILTSWAPDQIARLQAIAARLGPGALHDRVMASTNLTSAALSRATALHAVLGCHCPSKMTTDDLGPVPCALCSAVQVPKQSTAPPGPGQAPTNKSGGTQPHPKQPGVTAPSTAVLPTGPGSTSVLPGGGPTIVVSPPPITLPPLPLPLPTTTPPTSGGTSATAACRLVVLGVCIVR